MSKKKKAKDEPVKQSSTLADAFQEDENVLTAEQLTKAIFKALRPLDKLSFPERYTTFMGKAQIVEMALKRLLLRNYGFKEKQLEKLTLGAAIHHLEREGIRPDLVVLLNELNKFRIQMAHVFLCDDAIGKSLLGAEFQHLSEKSLRHALFAVEHVIQVYYFLSAHGLLDSNPKLHRSQQKV